MILLTWCYIVYLYKMWNFLVSSARLLTHSRMESSKLCIVCVLFILSLFVCQLDSVNAEKDSPVENPSPTTAPTTKPATTKVSATISNSTDVKNSNTSDSDDRSTWQYGDLYDKGMLRRGFYVLIGLTAFVVILFVYRSFRARRRKKTKKYGVLATRGSDMELRPLDQEDDEEDMTVFDVNSK